MRPGARAADRRVPVAGSWALSGAALGLLAEVLFPSTAAPWGTVGAAVVAGLAGWVAAGRVRAARMPLWLDLAPRLALAGALLLLAVVLVVVGSPLLAGVATLVGVGIGSSGRRPVARRRLVHAVEALREDVDPASALAELESLAAGWWVPPTLRAEAALQRGAWTLASGGAEEAVGWLARVRHRALVGHAAPWLALAHASAGRDDVAHAALQPAYGAVSPETRAHAEAVRLLLVLRGDGHEEAARLGTSLLDARPVTPLAFGLVAVARLRAGDEAGARVLMTTEVVAALEAGGLAELLEEVAEALRHLRPDQSFCE
ncbi:MAG: hypothetical protein H6732_08195 [Alphaproteobacteria bacterium]|nr:hypothetical protein [Alphaproteobacteria bacterium]